MTESEIREAIRHNSRQGLKPEKDWLEELHNLGADILKWKESKRWSLLEDAWVNDMIVFTRPAEIKAPISIYVNSGENYLCTVRDEWEAIKVADRLRSFCTPFIWGGLMKAGDYILSVDYDGSKYWITQYGQSNRFDFNPGHYGLIPL